MSGVWTYLDTNVLVRYYTGSHDPNPDNRRKALEAEQLLDRVEQRQERVVTNLATILETVFVLERNYKVSKPMAQAMLRDFIALPGVVLANKRLVLKALDEHSRHNISITDAYIVVDMFDRQVPRVYSWDTDFDRIPNIARIVPPGP